MEYFKKDANPQTVSQGQSVQPTQNVPQVQTIQPVKDVSTPQKRSGSKKIGVVLFSLLIVVALVAGGAYLLIKQQKSSEKQTDEGQDQGTIVEDDQTLPTVNVTSLSEANNYFGFNILKELAEEDEGKNIFISPISMEMALLMTYNGAKGETAEEMADVLGISDLDLEQINEESQALMQILTKSSEDVTMSIANSLWGRKDITFKQEYLESTTNYYQAKVESVDFSKAGTVDLINGWIEDNTNDKIQKMLSELDPLTVLVLVNAIYFKGTWEAEFDKDLTSEQDFTKGDGDTVTVDMMHQESDSYNYYEDEEVQLVELPYTDDETVMYVLLPKEGVTLDALGQDLDSAVWQEWTSGVESKEGTVELPKFKMEYGTKSLKNSLENLGMKLAFSAADFSLMSEQAQDWIIDDVLHKSFVDVNEEGTEAAAATAVIMLETAMEDDSKFYFRADHPFLFAIADKESGAVLFVGVMQVPAYS